jgi:cell wall assembly regulator SMI1
MNENSQIKKSWGRIEYWLSQNFPESVEDLHPPASAAELKMAENITGFSFPLGLKALLLIHNGEKQFAATSVLPGGHKLLSVNAIVNTWRALRHQYGKTLDDEAAVNYWRLQVEEKAVAINGPVKPIYGSSKWLPISKDASQCMRFLDFDPPEGGTPGQVIEADPERGIYQVLAPSLGHYLEEYAMDLITNKYMVEDERILLENPPSADPYSWPMPHYLSEDAAQYYDPDEQSDEPTAAQLESGERLMIVGEMTSLMGKEEILFSVETEQAKEYTFLAKPAFTKGFHNIAINQHARVFAKKFHGEIKSHFIEQGLASKPDFLALEYTMLRSTKRSNTKTRLQRPANGKNIDQLAQDILNSAQVNFQNRHDYREIKFDQMPHLHTKFYNNTTARFLKLGFHYIGDFLDQAQMKNKNSALKVFHAMSFFDDGIVACFYQDKGKLPWLFHSQGKVIEFETEFSDGSVIVSTNNAHKPSHPMPELVSYYSYPANIPLEGLLYKHRGKIRRYQRHNPSAAIVKVRNISEFIAQRNRRQQLVCDYLQSVGWVTKEYLAEQFKNKEIAKQVYDKIQQRVRH